MLLVLLAFPALAAASEPLPAALRAALDAEDCAAARSLAREVRDAGYYGGEPGVLFRAEGALAGATGCGVWPWVELAVGFDLLNKPVHGAMLLDSLAGAAADPIPFRRALALFRVEPEVVLLASRLSAFPDSASHERWNEPAPREVDRADQVLAGAEAWSGPEDGSVEIRAGLLAGNLYLRLRVRDDEVRDGDGVRVLLARLGGGRLASREPGNLSWVLALPPGNEARPTAVARVPKVWRTVVPTPHGYDVVVCVPAGTLGMEFNESSRRAFDVILTDVDAEGTSLHRWCGRSEDVNDMRLAGILQSAD